MSSQPARETSGVTTRLIVRYVRANAGAGAVDDLLRLAGERRPVSVLEDERTWSTYAQKIALFEAAEAVLADADVAQHIGEWVLREQIGLPVRMVLWALGTPAQLLRNVAKAATKFSTVAEMACVEAGATSATVTYRLHDGYGPSRHDCGYTRGLLSQATALFGLPAATVRHDECQLEGAASCVYVLSWPRRRRFRGGHDRVRRLERELRSMTDRVESLQRAAADIVAAEAIVDTIDRIGVQARSVIRAAGSVVLVQPLVGGPPVVRSDGLAPEEVRSLSEDLLAGEVASGPDRIVVELRSLERRYGWIAALAPGDDPFFPEERRMLAAFGGLAATALDASVSRETVRVLSGLAGALADVTGSDEVCHRVARAIPLVVGSPISAVARWHPEEGALRFVGVHGLATDAAEALRAVRIRPSDTPDLERQFESPVPLLYRSDTEDPFINALLATFHVEAAMTVPVVAHGALLGHVIAGWQQDAPSTIEGELVRRMSSLAAQTATALENAQLLETTTHQALHDALTGLPNRVLLDDRLAQAAARARRDGTHVGVLLVDLDGFKSINDRFGHRVGDDVLREVARRLGGILRDADTAARFGGDEFVLVCQGVKDRAEVEAIARRVEEVITQPVDLGGCVATLGASVGLAYVAGPIPDVDALLVHADHAMYEVKRRRPQRAPVFAAPVYRQ